MQARVAWILQSLPVPFSSAWVLTFLSGPQGWVSVLLLAREEGTSGPRRNVGALTWAGEGGPTQEGLHIQIPASPVSTISDPHSRVCLTSPDPDDPLSSYINANYIRVCKPIPTVSP